MDSTDTPCTEADRDAVRVAALKRATELRQLAEGLDEMVGYYFNRRYVGERELCTAISMQLRQLAGGKDET